MPKAEAERIQCISSTDLPPGPILGVSLCMMRSTLLVPLIASRVLPKNWSGLSASINTPLSAERSPSCFMASAASLSEVLRVMLGESVTLTLALTRPPPSSETWTMTSATLTLYWSLEKPSATSSRTRTSRALSAGMSRTPSLVAPISLMSSVELSVTENSTTMVGSQSNLRTTRTQCAEPATWVVAFSGHSRHPFPPRSGM
mmetsp:Transcript_6459/g.22237  ORF Transcript_6459/g.22237 Transcript_6459/m.22237 type:complete len:202 (-) Transcript_6459:2523-3128(-)